ncbi:hypothetical protein DFH11DRAFT_1806074 [Phellopilus nigrolimitatus]|nr:hypothetical protein DFH11DRAFT_1806074 [Phellopilus nigrolimitatus]
MDLDEIQLKTSDATSSVLDKLPTKNASDALHLVDQWYSKTSRKSRWMDLIGDYAGNETFVLDGDALIQVVLNDPLIALGRAEDPSFQIVHARWSIERLLKNLLDRSAVFDIVFWEDNRHLTQRTGASNYELASRQLARKILFNHLSCLNIAVYVFSSLSDPEWIKYSNLTRPMFVMTNDGGLAAASGSSSLEVEQVLCQRLFIHDLLANGLAISLLVGIEFRDSKILSFILEEQRRHGQDVAFPVGVYRSRDKAMSDLQSAESQQFPSKPSLGLLHLQPSAHSQSSSKSTSLSEHPRDFTQRFLANSAPDKVTYWLLSAFLSHCFVLEHLSLAQRAQRLPPLNDRLRALLVQSFLPIAFSSLSDVISDNSWQVDVDTRIFACILHIQTCHPASSLSDIVGAETVSLVKAVFQEYSSDPVGFADVVSQFPVPNITDDGKRSVRSPESVVSVLPFHNEVLDEELSLVHVKVDDSKEPNLPISFFDYGRQALFKDSNHWHNSKKILPKHLGGEDAKPCKCNCAAESTQASAKKHAETLTGAIGAPLKQQIIISVGSGLPKGKGKEKPDPTKKKQGKEKPLTTTEKLRLEIQSKKHAEGSEESAKWWKERLLVLEKITDLTRRDYETNALLSNDRTRRGWLALEKWITHEENGTDAVRDRFSLSTMRLVKEMYDRGCLSKTVRDRLKIILTALGFHDYISSFASPITAADEPDRPLSFKFTKLIRSTGVPVYDFMPITEHPIQWQLRLFGEFMDRSMDSEPDSRVSFNPDGWQRKVLNCLDAEKSVLVVAPTSAGKTFISFYAMEKVLRESDDGILVYVAPTKALVNQVASEVYARFKKDLRSGTCWAIHTRDYRINNPQKCQILVTVPEMFAIMLLSPPLARNWIPRIKRIILDEIHTIGQQEGGAVWEQILLLAPCPIIGLSATIGHPEIFNKWLSSVQEAHGIQHEFINHPHRYSHLRKFVYVRPEGPTQFKGLDHRSRQVESGYLRFIHPVTALAFRSLTLPPDLSLEARDALSLYLSLKQVESDIPKSIDIASLDPIKFFENSDFLKQKDVLAYEAKLKECLTSLMALPNSVDTQSPLQRTIASLSDPILSATPIDKLNTPPSPRGFLDGLMDLLTDLHLKDSLPALFFAFDRSNCEIMAQTVFETLQLLTGRAKSSQWEQWKRRQQDQQRAKDKMKNKRPTDDDSRDRQEMSSSWESTFNPDDPLPQFTFSGWKKYTKEDLNDDIKELSWTSTPRWALDALRRGLGVHHAGMNRQYRSLVESLFRVGFLRILFCTGTLALGINAPTKTSVFCGDSPFLTALMYRQCAGRAGRRGFDLLGNVVFYGLPMDRIQRLILSRLPSLTGNFPLTSTLCLRLLNLLHGAIKSIMNLPQISFGSDTGKEQLLHHLRFSIDYLRRAGLIDVNGKPMNLYAIVAHLYHTEPSNFALITLMRSGVLHKVCDQSSTEQAKRDLMLVLCHLFGRKYLHGVYASKTNLEIVRKHRARDVLLQHNSEILQVFSSYARLYATQYVTSLGPDNILPLSGLQVAEGPKLETTAGGANVALKAFLNSEKINVRTRSLFVANSGHDDTVHNVEELTRTCRRGLQLNEHAIPSLSRIAGVPDSTTLSGEDGDPKLNAYLYDYYVHGQVNTLVAANGIRRGDVWYALEDFNLTLFTIRAALVQLLLQAGMNGPGADTDLDIEASSTDVGGTDVDFDSGYGTGSASGAVTGEESSGEMEDSTSEFPRPPGVSDGDWKVYQVLNELTNEFQEKFKAMWA